MTLYWPKYAINRLSWRSNGHFLWSSFPIMVYVSRARSDEGVSPSRLTHTSYSKQCPGHEALWWGRRSVLFVDPISRVSVRDPTSWEPSGRIRCSVQWRGVVWWGRRPLAPFRPVLWQHACVPRAERAEEVEEGEWPPAEGDLGSEGRGGPVGGASQTERTGQYFYPILH